MEVRRGGRERMDEWITEGGGREGKGGEKMGMEARMDGGRKKIKEERS